MNARHLQPCASAEWAETVRAHILAWALGFFSERMAVSNVEVVHADATRLPFPNHRFSGATAFTMLHHVPSPAQPDRLLSEVRRVIRPGGVLIGVDSIDGPDWRELHTGDMCVPIEPATFPKRLLGAGFVDVEVERSSPAPARRFRFAARVPAAD